MTFRIYAAALGLAPAVASVISPISAHACACGCGVFDTGVTSITPQASDSGLAMFLRFSTMAQRDNREQGHAASPDDNADKRIQTDFYTIGASYTIGQAWTIMAEVPIYDRKFTTTGEEGGVETVPLTAMGDAVVQATWTGLSRDKATGLGFGIKLPTGRIASPLDAGGDPAYDRDTMPGTGSTDLQVTGYHVGHLTRKARWFVHAQYQFAVGTRDAYRPGNELDASAGVSYDLPAGRTMISPSVQLIGSMRAHDSGDNADPLNSGYQRLLIAPGLRVQLSRKLSVYADVAIPLAQYVNAARPADNADSMGQLVAPALFKLQVNYGF